MTRLHLTWREELDCRIIHSRVMERLQGALTREELAQHCPGAGGGGHRQWGAGPCHAVGEEGIYRRPFYEEVCLLFCIRRFAGVFCRLQKFCDFSKRADSSVATDYGNIILEKEGLILNYCISLSGHTKEMEKKKEKGDNSSIMLFNYQGSNVLLIFHRYRFSVMLFLAFSNFPNILQLDCFIGVSVLDCIGLDEQISYFSYKTGSKLLLIRSGGKGNS